MFINAKVIKHSGSLLGYILFILHYVRFDKHDEICTSETDPLFVVLKLNWLNERWISRPVHKGQFCSFF